MEHLENNYQIHPRFVPTLFHWLMLDASDEMHEISFLKNISIDFVLAGVK